jgi:hypothetical protein
VQAEHIVGRTFELSVLDSAMGELCRSDVDRVVACVIQGDPGIGKTTLWTYGVERARERGCQVLTCRPGEPESALSFAGLTDLVDAVPDAVFRMLPAPQRQALEVALLRATPDGAPAQPRAVNVATLSLVRLLTPARDRYVDDYRLIVVVTSGTARRGRVHVSASLR